MRPSLDQYLMEHALVAARRTTCLKRGVGCVLADHKGRILAVGYNGVASGQPHCNETAQLAVYHDDPRVVFDSNNRAFVFDGKSTAAFETSFFRGTGNRQCVGHETVFPHACKGHDLPSGQDSCEAVHAEQNAILQCRNPDEIVTAYVTLSPCKPCVKLLMNTGCQRIVFLQEHTDLWPREQWLKLGRQWEQLKM